MVFNKLRQALWNGKALSSPPLRRKENRTNNKDSKKTAIQSPISQKIKGQKMKNIKSSADNLEGNVSSKVCLFESISKGNIHKCWEAPRTENRRPPINIPSRKTSPIKTRPMVEGRSTDVSPHPDSATASLTSLSNEAQMLTIQRLPGEDLGLTMDVDKDGEWRITGIDSSSAAGRDGNISCGDRVVSINGAELSSESRADVLALLKELPLRVQLTISRPILQSGRELDAKEGADEPPRAENNDERQMPATVSARERKYHKRFQNNSVSCGNLTHLSHSVPQVTQAIGGSANVSGRLHTNERWKSDSCDSLVSGLTADSRCASTTSIDTLLMGDRDYLSKALGFREVTVDMYKTKGEYIGVSVMNGKGAMSDYFQIKRIHEGGAIGRSRLFQTGDFLCSLNEHNLMGIAKNELVRVMQNSEGHIQMSVLRKDDGATSRGVSPFPSRPGTPNSCDVDQLFSGVEVHVRGQNLMASGRSTSTNDILNSSSGPPSSRLSDNALFAQSRVKLRMSSTSGPFGFGTTNLDDLDTDDENNEEIAAANQISESCTQTSPARRPVRRESSKLHSSTPSVLRMEDRHLLATESYTDGSIRSTTPFSNLLTTEYELQNKTRGRPASPGNLVATIMPTNGSKSRHRPSFLTKVIRKPSRNDSLSKTSRPMKTEKHATEIDNERRQSLSNILNAEMQEAEDWLQMCLEDVKSVKSTARSDGGDSASSAITAHTAPIPARNRHGHDRVSKLLFNSIFQTGKLKSDVKSDRKPHLHRNTRNDPIEKTKFGAPAEVQVCKGIMGLGVKLKMIQGRAIVQEIMKRGPIAKESNVGLGDCILSINDQNLLGLTDSRLNNILRVLPRGLVTLVVCKPASGDDCCNSRQPPEGKDDTEPNSSTLKRKTDLQIEDRRTPCIRVDSFIRNLKKEDSQELNDDSQVIQVTLEKNTILGFCIDGGLRAPGGDRPVRIKRFFKGPMGKQASHVLRCGDEILSVNGLPFANLSHEEAWSLLRRLPAGRVEICVRRGDEQNTSL